MANVKISDLTAASAAALANEYEINEAGTQYRFFKNNKINLYLIKFINNKLSLIYYNHNIQNGKD